MKLIITILINSLLIQLAEAGTIKQLLNKNDLAIVEISKKENIEIGDFYIVSENHNQCLLEVIEKNDKLATVSSKQCLDKALLTINKQVEKSLFNKNLVVIEKPAVLPAANTENLEPFDFLVKNEKFYFDLLYYPKSNELSGSTLFLSNTQKFYSPTTKQSAYSRDSFLFQNLAFGLSNNVNIGILWSGLVSSTSTSSSTSTETTNSNSPPPSLILNFNKISEANTFYNFGVNYTFENSSSYSTRTYLALNASLGFDISSNENTKLNILYVTYNENATTKQQTMVILSLDYQYVIVDKYFIQSGLGIQSITDEVSKTSNLIVKYDKIPRYQINFGGYSNNAKTSFIIGYTFSTSKVNAKTAIDNYLDYTSNSVSAGIGYMF